MAENLNYADSVKTPSLLERSWCHSNNLDNCSKYGRLYTWADANDVCPEGWHLPDETEWNKLFTAVGGQSTACKMLKSQTGWYNNGNGTNAYGFSAFPAGGRRDSGGFYAEGNDALFWSATEYNRDIAYRMDLDDNDESAYLANGLKSYAFSVRCLKD
jgi:uncharacterized protein (TIGR02145 family)